MQRKARCAGCTECRCRGAIIGAVVGSGARREAVRLNAEIGRTHTGQRHATDGVVGQPCAITQIDGDRSGTGIYGGARCLRDVGRARVAVGVDHTIGQLVVGDEGQVAVVGGDIGVEQERASGLQGECATVAAGIIDRQRGRQRNVVIGLQYNIGAVIQLGEQGRHSQRTASRGRGRIAQWQRGAGTAGTQRKEIQPARQAVRQRRFHQRPAVRQGEKLNRADTVVRVSADQRITGRYRAGDARRADAPRGRAGIGDCAVIPKRGNRYIVAIAQRGCHLPDIVAGLTTH